MSKANEPEYPSLTPSAVQIRWKVPTEFPGCPQAISEQGLEYYAAGLAFGSVFSRNDYATSLVVHHHLSDDSLVVLNRHGALAERVLMRHLPHYQADASRGDVRDRLSQEVAAPYADAAGSRDRIAILMFPCLLRVSGGAHRTRSSFPKPFAWHPLQVRV